MFEELLTPKEGAALLEQHLSHICSRLHGLPFSSMSIILIGSYGRGEGAFIRRDNALCPVNDYDLLFVTAQPLSYFERRAMRKLSKELTTTLGVWHVDLIPMTEEELCSSEMTMMRFDAKFAGKVLDGDRTILARIPFSSNDLLPKSQYLDLLCNRLVTLLEAYPGMPVSGVMESERSSHQARQLAKVYFALVDSFLGKSHPHQSFYRKKLELLRQDQTETGRELWNYYEWVISAWNREQEARGNDYLLLWKQIARLLIQEILSLTTHEVSIPLTDISACFSHWRGR
ncbi:MAG: nucleotidyltransferase domain-containing protein, partial [Bdellovibrionales bacterium]|nr:nucleotidyltransferase domain-containing protein [Bdellovibrionales bacterium]